MSDESERIRTMVFFVFLVVIMLFRGYESVPIVESSTPTPIRPLRILVLGGSGFVGSHFVRKAALRGHEVVGISRRGAPKDWKGVSGVTAPRWISCDVTNTSALFHTISQEGVFDIYVHAVGVLFDSSSGLSQFNQWMSGSGSSTDQRSTYDAITRQSAFALMDVISQQQSLLNHRSSNLPGFIFISAAEAGWTFQAPVRWLENYLIAKRQVEHRLFSLQNSMRSIIFRPSYIWNQDSYLSLASVIPLYWLHYFTDRVFGWKGFFDAPVTVHGLAEAMLYAVEASQEVGIKRAKEIELMGRGMKTLRERSRVVVTLSSDHESKSEAIDEFDERSPLTKNVEL